MKAHHPRGRRAGIGAAFLALSLFLATGTAAAQSLWRPAKNVEIIAGAAPGGAQDITARAVERILQQAKLVETSSMVVNKPGGGGSIGWVYLSQHAGDAHYLEVGSVPLLTNHILGKDRNTYSDFTPVALLFSEYVAIAVRADSNLKSPKDLLDRLKTDSASISVAVATTLGNHNHIAASLVAKAAGGQPRRLRTVVFNSGGEAMTALLGGHVDVISASAASVAPHVQAGKVRVLAIAAPRRLAGALADVPTWKELGVDAVVDNWRGILAPRGISAQQVAYWETTFRRLTQTDEWRKDLEKNLWVDNFMGSAQTERYLKGQYAEFKSTLAEVGLVK